MVCYNQIGYFGIFIRDEVKNVSSEEPELSSLNEVEDRELLPSITKIVELEKGGTP